MFGYIRPVQGELKVREHENFKACYCGLCHALGEKYGLPSRFVLSYELVFLALLLWNPDATPNVQQKRCLASPFRKKRYCARNFALDTCAGYTVILTWWKLRDTIADESFLKTIPHRMASLVLRGAYRKAVRDLPAFDFMVREEVARLAEYERRIGLSLDGAADKFAKILCATVPESAREDNRRTMLELLYHLGRWIYIIDACDDYVEDVKCGRYNPVAARYPPVHGRIPRDGIERLRKTLTHSNNLLCLAFELLQENTWTEISKNIIYLGMPRMCEQVIRNM